MIEGQFFITPHAVRRYQARVRRVDYEDARQALINALAGEVRAHYRGQQDGVWIVRIRATAAHRDYRLLIDTRQRGPDQPLPAVVTVL